MRKLVMIFLATVLFANVTYAGPASFSVGPATAKTAKPAQPTASRFSRWFSSAPKPFANFRSGEASKPAAQPSFKATYNAALPKRQQAAPVIDPALSLANTSEKPSAELLVSFANAAEAQQKIDVAREQLKRAVGLAPTDAKTLRAAGHFEDRQGELKTAEALYRRALTSDPQAAPAVNDLAICLARQGRLEESVIAFNQAIQLRPEKALYRNNVAKVMVELDDEASALAQLQAVHAPAVAHYNLGYLLSASGKSDRAAENFKLALAADPTLEAARQALASVQPTAVPAVVASAPVAAPATVSLPPAPVAAPQVAAAPVTPVATPAPVPYYAPAAPAVATPVIPRLLPPIVRQR